MPLSATVVMQPGWKWKTRSNMHELSIAEGIVGVVRDSVQLGEGERVRTIEIVAGELTGIVPETLDFCFEFVAKDTILEGAALVVAIKPISGRCRVCSEEFAVESYEFVCPKCAATDIEMISGRELYVKQVEVV